MTIIIPYLRGPIPPFFLIGSTIGCILISIWCLQTGYTIIFQNLFYIPIILACVLYTRRGFLFSCVLALIYFGMVSGYAQDTTILLQAFIRVILFIGIAGVVTLLADMINTYEGTLRRQSIFQDNIISNALVWLMVLDHKGTILLWNTAAEEISGYLSEEVIGKADIWKLLYPEKEYRRQITETITRIVGARSSFENFETTIRTRTGEEKGISWNTKGIISEDEKVHEYIAIGVDITEKLIAEEALEKQTEFLQVLIDTLPVPIFYKNTDGVYIGCNTAFEQYFGNPRDRVIGKTVYELWPKKMADVYYNADLAVFTSPHMQQYETSMQYADGSTHQVVFYKAPYFDETDQVIGLVGTVIDITERKKTEEALVQANKKLNLLSSITRHDICNELQIIFGYIGLSRDYESDSRIKGYLDDACLSAQNIERQISFTRDYQSIGVHSPIWQDIGAVIIRTSQTLDIGPIQLQVEISGIEIYADPLIGKVFFNLIDNAKRYGETITWIRFSGSEGTEGYTIFCEDNGVGIPDEFKSKVFNREYYKHTGFGLNLSREILEITGIIIRETGKPGKGARFEILVPAGKYRYKSVDSTGEIYEN